MTLTKGGIPHKLPGVKLGAITHALGGAFHAFVGIGEVVVPVLAVVGLLVVGRFIWMLRRPVRT